MTESLASVSWVIVGCVFMAATWALQETPPSEAADRAFRALHVWTPACVIHWLCLEPLPFFRSSAGRPLRLLDKATAMTLLCALVWTWPGNHRPSV